MTKRADPRLTGIIALAAEGYTLDEIGREYGVTRERIRQILRAAGKSIAQIAPPDKRAARRRRREAARVGQHADAVAALWRSGRTLAEIATEVGIGHTATRRLVGEVASPRERRLRAAERGRERLTRWTAREAREAVRAAAEIVGGRPTIGQYDDLRKRGEIEGPSAARIVQWPGGWGAVLAEAGFEFNRPARGRQIPDERLAEALRRVQRQCGGYVSMNAYDRERRPDDPSGMTIRIRFDGWMSAMEALLDEAAD